MMMTTPMKISKGPYPATTELRNAEPGTVTMTGTASAIFQRNTSAREMEFAGNLDEMSAHFKTRRI